MLVNVIAPLPALLLHVNVACPHHFRRAEGSRRRVTLQPRACCLRPPVTSLRCTAAAAGVAHYNATIAVDIWAPRGSRRGVVHTMRSPRAAAAVRDSALWRRSVDCTVIAEFLRALSRSIKAFIS